MKDHTIWPVYDLTITCTRPDCVHVVAAVMAGHGVVGGGGPGRYTMCENCGEILTKEYDDEVNAPKKEEDEHVTGDKG